MPTSADVVIIGGGILGTSLAYYLAQKGAGDVVLLERASIADGSTGKAAAIVRMHYTNPVTVQLALRSRDLFLNWGERVGGPGVYTQWLVLSRAEPPGRQCTSKRHDAASAWGGR